MSDLQGEFRLKREPFEMAGLVSIDQLRVMEKKPAYIFLNLAQAYDSVQYEGVLKALLEQTSPPALSTSAATGQGFADATCLLAAPRICS